MKFKFSYEKLLEFYHQQEQIAQRDYNESLTRLEEEKTRLRQMHEKEGEALGESSDLRQQKTGTPVARLEQLDFFVKGQEVRIKRQREIVINHTQIVEQKQEILIAAVKETEILVKLKEKRQVEFKKVQNKKETKLNDELVVTRFKRGDS